MKLHISLEKVLLGLLGILLIVITIFLVLDNLDKSKGDIANNISVPFNFEKKLLQVKEANSNLILDFETTKLEEITSLVYVEADNYKSIILDKKTGKELTFEDLIKKENRENFANKERELLNLKYPQFIGEMLENSTLGTKFYYVKDNEVIIYYNGYDYPERLTLRINYQEIKDYLNFTPILDEEYENESAYDYDKNKKTIALTIDDGPSSKTNARLLDILAKNKVHATFFMVGKMMDNCQKCVLDTYQAGHEIGSHTYEHMNIKKTDTLQVLESLDKTNAIYNRITGDNIKLLRPPYGAYDAENKTTIALPFILWDLDTEDWRYRDKEHIVNYFLENAKDGDIILVHELYDETLDALEEVLPILYKQGFQVVSVSELANLKGINLENGTVYRSLK